MCGRFTLSQTGETLASRLAARWQGEPLGRPRYNIAPTQHAPVLRLDEAGEPVLEMFRWGLIPFWAKDPAIGNRMINARAETVAEKPAYRNAFKRQRCLVPVDGFYEWQKTKAGKVPHWIHAADGGVLTFAGLWECWRPEGAEPVHSFTILTTAPNATMAPIHDRMPVVVAEPDRARWLDPRAPAEALRELMRPFREDGLAARPVSTRVNSPANDDAGCIAPLA
jgi:putative SOS response-associated peptidase YedK